MRLIDADAQYDRLADELSWLMNFGDDVYMAVGEAIRNQPTAYDIDEVVEELESFAKLAEDRYVNGTSGKFALAESKCWVKAIEIVRQTVR